MILLNTSPMTLGRAFARALRRCAQGRLPTEAQLTDIRRLLDAMRPPAPAAPASPFRAGPKGPIPRKTAP